MLRAGGALLLVSGCAGGVATDWVPVGTMASELEKCGIPIEAVSQPQTGLDQGTLRIDAGRVDIDDKALLCAGEVAEKRGVGVDFGSDALARRYLDATRPAASEVAPSDVDRARATLAAQGRLETLPIFDASMATAEIGAGIVRYCEVTPPQKLVPIADGFRLEPGIGAAAAQCVVATMIATDLAARGLYPTIVVTPPITTP